MPYTITIIRLADGVTRLHHSPDDWILPDPDGPDGDRFYWTEGNAGCDCNRALYFKRAAGEPDEDDETPCGDQRLYWVPHVTLPDGRTFEIDGPLPEP